MVRTQYLIYDILQLRNSYNRARRERTYLVLSGCQISVYQMKSRMIRIIIEVIEALLTPYDWPSALPLT